jgi:hypothetical protein
MYRCVCGWVDGWVGVYVTGVWTQDLVEPHSQPIVLFTHSPAGGYLDCFYFGAMMNNASVNMGVKVFVSVSDFTCLDYIPRSEIAELCGSSMFRIFQKPLYCFPHGLHNFTPSLRAAHRSSNFWGNCHNAHTCYFLGFDISHLNVMLSKLIPHLTSSLVVLEFSSIQSWVIFCCVYTTFCLSTRL